MSFFTIVGLASASENQFPERFLERCCRGEYSQHSYKLVALVNMIEESKDAYILSVHLEVELNSIKINVNHWIDSLKKEDRPRIEKEIATSSDINYVKNCLKIIKILEKEIEEREADLIFIEQLRDKYCLIYRTPSSEEF